MIELVEGIDYTRSGNTLTFTGSYVGQAATVVYQVDTGGAWHSALGQLGLSLAPGVVGQPVWSWLQSFDATQALAYSGLSYVYAERYQLTNQAEVENHSFEVVTATQVGGGVVDAWPQDVLRDFLGNPFYGVGWAESRLAPLTDFQNYCKARQLWLSPVMEEQRPARDWMQDFADITNCEWVWQGTVLDLVPRGDEVITSTYGTYTPNTTPAFDLVHAEGGDLLEPVQIEPVVNEDAKNIIRIQWTNRANGYAVEIMEARDAAHIELYGERPAEVRNMEAIHDAAVAQSVAQQILQREMTVWNRYTFRTPFSRALISLMTLVTLTDDDSGLDRVPVRIIGRREDGKLTYEFLAEDAPIGAASAPIYGQQAGAGFAHDFNAAPGDVIAPVFFEAPVERTTTGLEVYAAVTGSSPMWGGCRVWVSLDGMEFKRVTTMHGGSRFGVLTAAIAAASTSLGVQLLGNGGKLLSGSASDAAQAATLCWLLSSDGGEYVTYQGATLTGANAYTLASLGRGVFDSVVQAHDAGAAFVRVDDAIAKSGPLDVSLIGTTIYFKFTSFNVYGGGEQDISEVDAYPYTITGGMAHLPPPPVDRFKLIEQPGGIKQWFWDLLKPPADLFSFEVVYSLGTEIRPWGDMIPLFAKDRDARQHETVEPRNAEVYTFAIRTVDTTGNVSTPFYITEVLDGDAFGTVLLFVLPHEQRWPGIQTDCYVDGPWLVNSGTTTWDDLDVAWDDADITWDNTPTSPIVYEHSVIDLGASIATTVRAAAVAAGASTVEMSTSDDGITYSAWSEIPNGAMTARYFKFRWTVSGSNPTLFRAQVVFYT